MKKVIVPITTREVFGVDRASIEGARCIAAAAKAMNPACITPKIYPDGRGRKVYAVRRIHARSATRGTKLGAGDNAARASTVADVV